MHINMFNLSVNQQLGLYDIHMYIDNSITVLFYMYFLDDNKNDTNDNADAHYHKYHSYSNPGYSTSGKLIWKAKTKYEIIT